MFKKNWKKMANKYQKYAKIRDVKIMQDIPFNLKIIQKTYLQNPRGGSLALI